MIAPEILSDVNDLITSDHETDGRPVFPSDRREKLLTWLHSLLVDRDGLRDYIRYLQKQLGTRFRHTNLPPEEKFEEILEHGLETLDNDVLAALLLNPVALSLLADEIEERLPEVWLPDLKQNGLALLRRNSGKSEFDIGEFIRGLTDGSSASQPLVSGVLGGSVAAEASRTWKFVFQAERCRWLAGEPPASVAGSEATLDVEWDAAAGQLLVLTGGFLRRGDDYALHVVWQALDGSVRAEARSDPGQLTPAVLRPQERRGPVAGEHLQLRHLWQPEKGDGWEISIEIVFSDKQPA